jgi:hypothetical protein
MAELEAEQKRKQEEAERQAAEERARQEALVNNLDDDDESSDVSAQNKQIADIMRDQSLSAVEKQMRTQAIRAGKIDVPAAPAGNVNTPAAPAPAATPTPAPAPAAPAAASSGGGYGVANPLPWQPPGGQQPHAKHQPHPQQQQRQQQFTAPPVAAASHHEVHHGQSADPDADLDVDVQAFALNLNSLTGFTEDDMHIGMDDVMAMATGGHSHAQDKQSYMSYAPFVGVSGTSGGGFGGANAGNVSGSRLFGGGAGLASGLGGGMSSGLGSELGGLGGGGLGGGGLGGGGLGGIGSGGSMGLNGGGSAAGSRLFERWSAPHAGMPFSQNSDEENFTEASMASTASGTRTPLNLEMDEVPGSPEIYSDNVANQIAMSALDFRQPQQSRFLQQGMQQQQRGMGQLGQQHFLGHGKQMQKKPGFPQYQQPPL